MDNCLDFQTFCNGLDQHPVFWRLFDAKESCWTNNKVLDWHKSGVVSRLKNFQFSYVFSVFSYDFVCSRLLYTGPFYVTLILTVLVSNILLQIKLRRLPMIEEDSEGEVEENLNKKKFWIVIPTIMTFLLVGYRTVSKDDIAQTIFMTLLFALIQTSVPLIYILKLPKLKEFTWNQWKELRKNQVSPV